jgi:hypothetical protein
MILIIRRMHSEIMAAKTICIIICLFRLFIFESINSSILFFSILKNMHNKLQRLHKTKG